jgi:hypothetical protein
MQIKVSIAIGTSSYAHVAFHEITSIVLDKDDVNDQLYGAVLEARRNVSEQWSDIRHAEAVAAEGDADKVGFRPPPAPTENSAYGDANVSSSD